jgi:CheY-like chemotaxis protein
MLRRERYGSSSGWVRPIDHECDVPKCRHRCRAVVVSTEIAIDSVHKMLEFLCGHQVAISLGEVYMRRVVVVEDDVSVGDLVVDVLRSRGYDVLLARDGNEAAALCAQGGTPLDVLLCDLVIPGLRSGEVVRIAVGLYPGLKVLVMTGWPDEVAIRDSVPGRLCVLQKPFTLAQLLRCVKCVEWGNACEGRKIGAAGIRASANSDLERGVS